MTSEQRRFYIDLCEKSTKELICWAARHTGDDEFAKDAVQTVFLILIEDIETVYRHDAPRGWLYRTLRNVIGNEIKRKRREVVGLTDEILAESEAAVTRLFGDNLLELLPNSLKESEKEIINLRITDRLSYSQIAQILGLEEAAARQRMKRALASCLELLLQL